MNDPLEAEVTFGKYKGTHATWRQVLERDPDYAQWLVEHAEALPDDVRDAMGGELEDASWGFSK